MNDIAKSSRLKVSATILDTDRWSKLMALADMIEIDEATGSLEIRNGKARAVLRADGVVIVEGVRILQSAERDVAIQAAIIDLN